MWEIVRDTVCGRYEETYSDKQVDKRDKSGQRFRQTKKFFDI